MRLSISEQKDISTAIESVLGSKPVWEIYLFGSRTLDHRKGGDLDLLLIVENSHLDRVKKQKIDLLLSLKERLGEQKIDLIIASPDEIDSNSFLKKINGEKISL
jgi:predicted nucleotidyltransferase